MVPVSIGFDELLFFFLSCAVCAFFVYYYLWSFFLYLFAWLLVEGV